MFDICYLMPFFIFIIIINQNLSILYVSASHASAWEKPSYIEIIPSAKYFYCIPHIPPFGGVITTNPRWYSFLSFFVRMKFTLESVFLRFAIRTTVHDFWRIDFCSLSNCLKHTIWSPQSFKILICY